jgi:hypothetical protein
MCRYMFERYREHWACLRCRRSVKAERYWPQTCRECRQPMLRMGQDFHAPRRADRRQWLKLEILAGEYGQLFFSCGCTGPGPRPRTLADAKSQFGRRRSSRRQSAPKAHDRGRRTLMPT